MKQIVKKVLIILLLLGMLFTMVVLPALTAGR